MPAGATYEPIQTYTLSSAASSIDFTSIASSWTDLKLVIIGTCSSGTSTVDLTFNNDTATNYSMTRLRGDGSSATAANYTNRSYIWVGSLDSTTVPTMATVDIFSYSGSTYKTLLSSIAADLNGSGTVQNYVGLWRSTSAITSIKLSAGNFNTGTTATLYGIKAA